MSLILTIGIVTYNRAEQLKNALQSCLACVLPSNTEFVIIDNASTDNTETVVNEILENSGYNFYYEKLNENVGCGRGRNYAFSVSNGEYYYSLDDDAVIDKNNLDFFTKALGILDENPEIATLTTQIYDTAWQDNRMYPSSIKIGDDLYECFMFCGGSHFLRRKVFSTEPYFANLYGYEEIPPSLYAADKGFKNVFYSAVRIIHMPKVDKWNKTDKKNHRLLVNEFVLQYVFKKHIFPSIFTPIVYAAYKMRVAKYLKGKPNNKRYIKEAFAAVEENAKLLGRIKSKTVIMLFKKFGLAVF